MARDEPNAKAAVWIQPVAQVANCTPGRLPMRPSEHQVAKIEADTEREGGIVRNVAGGCANLPLLATPFTLLRRGLYL